MGVPGGGIRPGWSGGGGGGGGRVFTGGGRKGILGIGAIGGEGPCDMLL